MKAAVWTKIGKIEVCEVEKPAPKKGEVLIKVRAAGLCVTDLHVYTGQFAYGNPPHILGHEIAGDICEVGENVSQDLIGKRVTVETSIGCGSCELCLSGKRHLCADMTEIGFAPHSGGYAEYVKAPAANVIELPENVTYEEAGIIESVVCPMGSLMRNGINFGETVAIFGVGPAGLAYVQGAKVMGAGKVIVIARDNERLSRALDFGADVAINSKEENLVERIMQETDGKGADLVCEAAGVPETILQSFKIVRKAGRVILYGIPADSDKIDFPVTSIVTNQIEVYGTVGEPAVWKPLLQMVSQGRINLRDMVTHKLKLEDINKGFEIMRTKEDNPIKIVIEP